MGISPAILSFLSDSILSAAPRASERDKKGKKENPNEALINQIRELSRSFNDFGAAVYIAYKTEGFESKDRAVVVIPEAHFAWGDSDPMLVNCGKTELLMLYRLIDRYKLVDVFHEGTSAERKMPATEDLLKYRKDIYPLLQNPEIWLKLGSGQAMQNIFGKEVTVSGAGDPVLFDRANATILFLSFYSPAGKKDVFVKQSAGQIFMDEQSLAGASEQASFLCNKWGLKCETKTVQLKMSRPKPELVTRKFIGLADNPSPEELTTLQTGLREEMDNSTAERTAAIARFLSNKIKPGKSGVLIVGADHADIYKDLEKNGFGVIVMNHTYLRQFLQFSYGAPNFLK